MYMENYEIGYYVINSSKRVLYWNGEEWQQPIKDNQKRFGSYVAYLEKQPKIKNVTPVEDTEYKNLFKLR